MKRLYLIFGILLFVCALWIARAQAGHPIASAQFTESGMIRVVMNDGREFDVPDDMANRHRRQLAAWVAEGHSIAPADPVPLPARQELIRNDPDFPKPAEFMEAFLDCRFAGDCAAAQALRERLTALRLKYP
ncbi:MAG: hypothetical protein GWM98_00190 [Nitrospinaceae bacterium]|nr:hypothetical protein [Nitrospinaceae bacterium]NIR53230.1 hypothetical protein [Nitrospinaceae bacterium]NIS83625.1 hypothetical protein [Nitrospinaceae bacterium]NIT80415.1 hypothetical protein [Nitrospinaceae bacterium]NIU42758.1 hypothetical protein [Nitrospinaceae bacterium]